MSSLGGEVKEFYYNDVVYRFDKQRKIHFGVVTETFEGTNSDGEDFEALTKGYIRVWWVDDDIETVWRESKVKLLNRTVMPGDIVRRLENGKETQRGYCKEVQQYASVQVIGTNKIVDGVYYERLCHAIPFDINSPISLKNKVGRIKTFDQLVTLSTKCGSLVKISINANGYLENYWHRKKQEHFVDVIYPGHDVLAVPSEFKHPNWIHKSTSIKRYSHSKQRFTVQNVDVTDVEVIWYDSEDNATACFLSEEEIKQIKILNTIEIFTLEIGESRLLKLNESDVLLRRRNWLQNHPAIYQPNVRKVVHSISKTARRKSRAAAITAAATPISLPRGILPSEITPPPLVDKDKDWCTTDDEDGDGEEDEMEEEVDDGNNGVSSSSLNVKQQQLQLKKKRHFPPRAAELVAGNTLAVEVVCVYSKVTIVWQDCSVEYDIPTTELYYSISLDDHEFFPGECVQLSTTSSSTSHSDKYAVIQHVDYLQRVAKVKYFKEPPTGGDNHTPIELEIDEISVYDLKKHRKYSFRPGSIVKNNTTGKLGTVVDSCIEGNVLVRWLSPSSCHSSLHTPQELVPLPDVLEYDSEEEEEDNLLLPGGITTTTTTVGEHSDEDDTEDSINNSWETESVESVAGGDMTDAATLQTMAARLDFVRTRIVYLKEVMRQYAVFENFTFIRDLLIVYDNSSYLDKLLDTSYFSLKSKHYQALLGQVRERAKKQGVELRGRLFCDHHVTSSGNTHNTSSGGASNTNATKSKTAEKENMSKVMKLEHKVNSQLGNTINTANIGNNVNTVNCANNVNKVSIVSSVGKQQSCSNSSSSSSTSTSTASGNSQTTAGSVVGQTRVVGTADGESRQLSVVVMASATATSAAKITGSPGTPDVSEATTPAITAANELNTSQDSICVELLSMLKTRMDLAYAEIIARIGGAPVLTVMTKASDSDVNNHCTHPPRASTPLLPSYPTTPDDSFTSGDVTAVTTNTTTTTTAVVTPNKSPAGGVGGLVVTSAVTVTGGGGVGGVVVDEESDDDVYRALPEAPSTHRYYSSKCEPSKRQHYFTAICREHVLMRDALPPGVWVRTYHDRLDLCSFLIAGPAATPYADGLFAFDVQFSPDYPRSPPLCHYVSYCAERLNPNLYVEGRVCVSLLGTWLGKDTEVWGKDSTLLQLIVSIQGLILVAEPYYNEAGYEKHLQTQQGTENSRIYNELVVVKLVQSMTTMLRAPPAAFLTEVPQHFARQGKQLIARLQAWCDGSSDGCCAVVPEFPLLPVSKGLKLSLRAALKTFQQVLDQQQQLT